MKNEFQKHVLDKHLPTKRKLLRGKDASYITEALGKAIVKRSELEIKKPKILQKTGRP